MVTQEQIDKESERLLKKYLEFGDEYRNKICSKCIGTNQQIVRECAKLNGFKSLGCEHMTRAITRRLHPNNTILLQMALGKVMEELKRD